MAAAITSFQIVISSPDCGASAPMVGEIVHRPKAPGNPQFFLVGQHVGILPPLFMRVIRQDHGLEWSSNIRRERRN